ncbi:MAG TPA: hypothetical protein VF796_21290, partial [Humisphaera sp.]
MATSEGRSWPRAAMRTVGRAAIAAAVLLLVTCVAAWVDAGRASTEVAVYHLNADRCVRRWCAVGNDPDGLNLLARALRADHPVFFRALPPERLQPEAGRAARVGAERFNPSVPPHCRTVFESAGVRLTRQSVADVRDVTDGVTPGPAASPEEVDRAWKAWASGGPAPAFRTVARVRVSEDGWGLTVSHWLAVGLAAGLVALPLVPRVAKARRRARRRRRGQCLPCGYDLRATPGRCP